MAAKRKERRKYLKYLGKAIDALLAGIDRINSVHDNYRVEESVILITNAWELLSKAILLKQKVNIQTPEGYTISVEQALTRLVGLGFLKENESQHIQQIVSLRNAAIHSVLPPVPQEILFHLQFYAIKFFKDLVGAEFPPYAKRCSGNFLSLSFDTFTTYADKVQKLISKARKRGTNEQELVWLLERGVRFDGGQYVAQNKFEEEIKALGKKKRLYPNLKIANFVKAADMVVVVPVQAPKGYTADINLRKGPGAGTALPVMIKKTDLEQDFPFLTSDLGRQLGKGTNFVSKTVSNLGMKGDPTYHQSVRTSKSGQVGRYSQKALDKLKKFCEENPSYNPYKQTTKT